MKANLLVTPRQFLEDLQREHYKESLPSSSADASELPVPILVTSIPARHHHLLREIGAGFGPANSINASVFSLPGDAQVIVLDFGIVSFLTSLNKILLSRANILGFEPTMEFDLAASRADSVVRSFLGDEDLPRFSTSPRRTSIASSLSNLQTSFVLGHELSHLLLGHFNSTTRLRRREMEYVADARGAKFAITGFKNAHDPILETGDTALVQAGVDIFFTYYMFMNKISRSLLHDTNSTHPLIEQRRARLRERFWDELPEDARSLASSAESLFDSFFAPPS